MVKGGRPSYAALISLGKVWPKAVAAAPAH